MLGAQATFTWKPGPQEFTVRAWAEFADGSLSSEALDLLSCTADLLDESGSTVASVIGAADSAGASHALFRLSPVTLVAGHHYLLIVGLRTSGGDPVGPRTLGVPVS